MGVFFWRGAMIEFHAITPHGRELVAQVVDGKLVIPTFSEVIPPEFTVAPVASQAPVVSLPQSD